MLAALVSVTLMGQPMPAHPPLDLQREEVVRRASQLAGQRQKRITSAGALRRISGRPRTTTMPRCCTSMDACVQTARTSL